MKRNKLIPGQMTMTPNGSVMVTKEEKEPPEKSIYTYSGPVKHWDKTVISNFNATTQAVSEKQAINNFLYQVKKRLNLSVSVGGIRLINKVHKVEE